MLRLSKLTDYAIVVMSALAKEPDHIYNVAELGGATHLEPPTVSKVLKKLVKSGLIRSYRGTHGGYQLSFPAARISVADIIVAMDGPIGMTECSVHQGRCSQEPVCALRSNWRRISQAIEIALANVTLADMRRSIAPPVDLRPLRITTINA